MAIEYPFTWKDVNGSLRAFFTHPKTGAETMATWAPQYGSQTAFLSATNIFEVLYAGTRGPGKTDTMLMDFAQHVGKGFGQAWRGVIFRKTFAQLSDVILKSQKIYPIIFPGAKFNSSESVWVFPQGEILFLRYMEREADYWNHHGKEYPWIAFEELTTWADDKCYRKMMSCCRSSMPGMPRCIRATTNPSGAGHNWVKRRFQLPQSFGRIIYGVDESGHQEPPRVAINGTLKENKVLLHADPDYEAKLRQAASNPHELKAWLEGSWDIVSGGMFDDLWDGTRHVLPSFPLELIPDGWRIDRSFDWGSSKPFAVIWWAESNGEPMEYNGLKYGSVRGDIIAIREWYGWNKNRNEGLKMTAASIAAGIVEREKMWGLTKRCRPGPADSAIFGTENGVCIAKDMEQNGVRWEPSYKGAGSRKQGWEVMRGLMAGAVSKGGPREHAGIFALSCCEQWIETVPTLPRSEKDPDDVLTEAEDHMGDATRYRILQKKKVSGQRLQ